MKEIEFFFDFASPYAYLAHCRLPALADKYGYQLKYMPINLFAARQAAGNTGPMSTQIPTKFRYIQTDLKRWAQKYDVPFVLPWGARAGASAESPKTVEVPKGGIDTSRAHKGMFFANEQQRGRDYATHVWRRTYGSGGVVGDDEVLRSVAQELRWSPETFFEFVRSEKAQRLYDEANRQAHLRGVFGVPIMIVGEEMWWGNDRLSLLEDYLAANAAR